MLVGVLATIVAFGVIGPSTSSAPLLGALGVIGIDVGLFTPAFITAALQVVSPQEVGSAAGLINAVQQLGATLGVAVLGSSYLASAGPSAHADALGAVQHAFWLAAALLVATALTAALMTAPRRRTRPTSA